jgi:hypothetical protein
MTGEIGSGPGVTFPNEQAQTQAARETQLRSAELRAPSEAPSEYLVVKGDNLTRIARRLGVSIAALRKANPKICTKKRRNGGLLFPGDRLTVPTGSWAPRVNSGSGQTLNRPKSESFTPAPPKAPTAAPRIAPELLKQVTFQLINEHHFTPEQAAQAIEQAHAEMQSDAGRVTPREDRLYRVEQPRAQEILAPISNKTAPAPVFGDDEAARTYSQAKAAITQRVEEKRALVRNGQKADISPAELRAFEQFISTYGGTKLGNDRVFDELADLLVAYKTQDDARFNALLATSR